MERLSDWPERLNSHIDTWRNIEFQWGQFDCAHFCLGAELAMCGKSRFTYFKGSYKTEIGAARALIKNGCTSLVELIDGGLPEIQPKQATRGDLGALRTVGGVAVGIITGSKVAGMGPDGLVFPSIDMIYKAWKI